MKKIFFLGFCLCIFMISPAQVKLKSQLSGRITDARTGQPLSGASVVLADSRNGTTTDSTGYFMLKNIPGGHTIIEISYSGYKTLVEHLDLGQNEIRNFMLSASMLENEGVTITAVANATSIRKAPIPISRVNKSELLASASSNIIDALSRQPGISQLSTGPAISKPIIRGLGYNRLVVINDGIRQEGQQWGDEHGIEIDESSVSRVEIVKGPASLIYGSDAIAGVINIITTAPVSVNTVKGNILSSYQTNNRQRSVFANLGGNKQGFNWNGWADYKAAIDYKNKYDGRVFNSKFKEHNYGGYAGYNGSWGFTHLIFSKFNQDLGIIEGERDGFGKFLKQMPGGSTAVASESDFESINPKVPYQRISHLKLISDNSFKAGKGRISLNIGWQSNQRFEFGDPDAQEKSSLHFDLGTFNYSLMYHLAEKNKWTSSVGVNGMQQNNHNKGEEVLIPEYGLFDIGAFVYTQKSWGRTTLSGGFRFDHRALKSKEFMDGSLIKFSAFKRNYANFSSSAGISYTPKDNFVFRFNLASGFRAPSIPELASNGAHEGTNRYEYGQLDLKSERSFQMDLGAEINSEHILATGNLFYNHINNFIFYSKIPASNGGDSLVNVGGNMIPAFQFSQHDASLAGAELLVDLHPHPLDWLHWQNTISYVRGRFSSSAEFDKDLPFIPAMRWISELRGEFLDKGKHLRNLILHFDADHSFEQKNAFTAYDTETPTPGYTILNAGLSGNIMNKNKVLFSLYLNASNIGDVAWQSHLSRLKYTDVNLQTFRQGVFNMGRNFSFKLNIPLNID